MIHHIPNPAPKPVAVKFANHKPKDSVCVFGRNKHLKLCLTHDGQVFKVISKPLSAGPQGPAGPAGPSGAPGAQGPQGTSVMGDPGATGADGADGAQGATGNLGATGPAGPKGDTGNDGTNGANGVAGSQGVQGIAGPVGPAGPQGAAGAAGTQITGVIETGNHDLCPKGDLVLIFNAGTPSVQHFCLKLDNSTGNGYW